MRVKKNIAISEETYDRLKQYGRFGDTYDDVLNKLMDAADHEEVKSMENKK